MTSDQMKIYKSLVITFDALNGGRMSASEALSGAIGDVLPHVPKAERTAGSEKYFKIFLKAADDADGTLIDAQVWLDIPTAGEDWITLYQGTPTDTQGDRTGAERHYGCAYLKTDITAGDATCVVTVEDLELASGAKAIFAAGDLIRPTDMLSPTAVTGNEEFKTIDSVSVDGLDVTITITGTWDFSYLAAAASRVSSVIELGDIVASAGAVTPNTAGDGTYDDTGFSILGDNLGTVDDIMRLTFDDANNFTGSLVNLGTNLGSGDKSSNFSPLNTASGSKPYGTVPAGGWTGTWAAGDYLDIPFVSAGSGLWVDRKVPVLCAALSNNKMLLGLAGESAS